jgi:glycosyltransferase involved in cell wall biosynthesis
MSARLPLSIIIIARDEADRIPRALASAAWADEVIVVDSGSRDATCAIARRAGARVIPHPWQGYAAQKAFALTQAAHPWVFWLDADEEITPALRASIESALTLQARGTQRHAAYAVRRCTVYLGRAIRHGGWYPDRKLRLFLRDRARFDDRLVHESVSVEGSTGSLAGDLVHHSFRDFRHHLEKTREMAELWARQERGRRRARASDLLLRPLAKGMKGYVWKRGFLDGWRGLLVAGMGSYAVWLKYALLLASDRAPDAPAPAGRECADAAACATDGCDPRGRTSREDQTDADRRSGARTGA